MAPKPWYRWTRDVHLYVGLFVGPFVVLYACSAILFNHAYLPWTVKAPPKERTVRVSVGNAENSLEVAKNIRDQLGVSGEIGFVNRSRGGRRITFPLETPTRTTNVRVDLDSGVATLQAKEQSVWEASLYLHRMPGPHNANIRGNWIMTKLWGWVADISVYAVLFLTITGIYLWTVLRAERRAGLAFIGAGMVSFIALLMAVVA